MKKLLSIFLAMILTLSLVPNVFASVTTETKLTFELTCDNEKEVTKESGDTILVTYSIKNASKTNFNIETVANEITFDPTFFEFVRFIDNPLRQNNEYLTDIYDVPYIQFNQGVNPAVEYAANQIVGTFELKIIAKNGSSIVRSEKRSAKYNTESYDISVSDLIVNIGDSVAPTTYRVEFITNGGRTIGDVLKEKDATIDLSEYTTEQSDKVFDGWYLDEQLTNKAPNELKVDKDLKVYAKWAEIGESTTHKLSFNTNGGSAISAEDFANGATVNLTVSKYQPTRTDHTFGGWYLDAQLTNKAPNTITINADTTLYAKWTKNSTDGGGGGGTATPTEKQFTLSFNSVGGSSISSERKDENTVVDITQSKYTPTKDNYVFDGWYYEADYKNKATDVKLTKDITVYAKWTKKSAGTGSGGGGSVTRYTLSFETNGGSNIDSVLKVRNTTVDLSKYITGKSGYSFDGWFTDKELTNKVTTVQMTSSITLYAKWVQGDNGYVSNPNYKPDIFAEEHNAYIVGREGGYIAPNENITRAEAATIFFRLLDGQVLIEGMTKQNNFTDVNEGDWFNTAVSTLTNLGVLNGRTTDAFAPNELITRAEFMTIVARLSEAKYEGKDLFIDIAGHWAKDYINIAASIEWANGYGVIFKPDISITRAEAFTIVNRATNRLPENSSDLLDEMIVFVDNSDVNAWYYIHVQEATNSHNFEMKADGIHEKWMRLNENPNWSDIEK